MESKMAVRTFEYNKKKILLHILLNLSSTCDFNLSLNTFNSNEYLCKNNKIFSV